MIPSGGYSCNNKYSKKGLKWLVHMEQTDGCRTMHAINARKYTLPELPHFSVDGYCAKIRMVYEFLGCFYHGHTCQPFRDVSTMRGEILSERYERTMSGMERITRAVYQLPVQWECEFDDAKIVE